MQTPLTHLPDESTVPISEKSPVRCFSVGTMKSVEFTKGER